VSAVSERTLDIEPFGISVAHQSTTHYRPSRSLLLPFLPGGNENNILSRRDVVGRRSLRCRFQFVVSR
jgi:hypothetical protein